MPLPSMKRMIICRFLAVMVNGLPLPVTGMEISMFI